MVELHRHDANEADSKMKVDSSLEILGTIVGGGSTCCDCDDYEESKERFYDMLGAHIIISGGKKFSHNELKDKPLQQIVDMIWPNGIRLEVKKEI